MQYRNSESVGVEGCHDGCHCRWARYRRWLVQSQSLACTPYGRRVYSGGIDVKLWAVDGVVFLLGRQRLQSNVKCRLSPQSKQIVTSTSSSLVGCLPSGPFHLPLFFRSRRCFIEFRSPWRLPILIKLGPLKEAASRLTRHIASMTHPHVPPS